MFEWLGDIFSGMSDAIGGIFEGLGKQVSNAIWDAMLGVAL